MSAPPPAFETAYGVSALASSSSLPPSEVEVAVVGGGIVGVSAALWLARRGVSVAVLEKGTVASEQSGRNWGFVRQQARDLAELPLAMRANRIWRGLVREFGARSIGWTQGGNLALSNAADRISAYQEWARTAGAAGLDTRILSMDEVRHLLPGVAGEWRAALYTPGDAHAHPVHATTAIARAARAAGAHLITGCTVRSIELNGGAVAGLSTSLGPVRCRTAVLAAGIWSSRLGRSVGIDIPQGLVTNSVAATQPLPPLTACGVWTQEVAFRQMPDGRVVLSAGTVVEVDAFLNPVRHATRFFPLYWKNRESFRLRFHHLGSLARRPAMRRFRLEQPRPDLGLLNQAVEEFRRRFPHLREARIEKAWAGLIDGTPDSLPVIEALDRPRGLVVATGFSGHGFCLGPAAGEVVADLVTKGGSQLELEQFRLGRFADRTYGEPRSLL